MDILGKIMKFRPVYLYLGLIIIIIMYLVISLSDTKNINSVADIQNKDIPKDEIHQGMTLPGQQVPGKSNVSAEVFQKLGTLKNAFEKSPNDTVKIREYADFLMAAHQTENAIPLYQKLVKLNPQNSDAHFSLTYIYYLKKDLNKAESENEIILSYDKNNSQALYNKGAITAAKGDKKKAKKILSDVLNRFPGTEAAKLAESALQNL
ncbi:MAG: hypothetical protein CO128_08345 [Ignavibacteriales bacterium CG_4_9_14_3_um_filter_30_11]|nr:MAG: hypothetical protein CO128_08345 [Ignavibacteriales bacterium CG_4_9_14_3_um_filter_30_11]